MRPAPRVRSAEISRICELGEQLEQKYGLMEDALERLPLGVILVGAEGTPVFRNKLAREIIDWASFSAQRDCWHNPDHHTLGIHRTSGGRLLEVASYPFESGALYILRDIHTDGGE